MSVLGSQALADVGHVCEKSRLVPVMLLLKYCVENVDISIMLYTSDSDIEGYDRRRPALALQCTTR